VHSLDVAECEKWIDTIQAGNLYVNRGITGAIVNRQPFGGWKRSSVGPTSKAGGPNYLNNLRDWKPLVSASEAITTSTRWWNEVGSKAIDHAGLKVERNYQRYRPSTRGIVVRIDAALRDEVIRYLLWIAETTKTSIEWSSATMDARVPVVRIESVDDLIERASGIDKIRWLSQEVAPNLELLERGISVDTRPVASRGDIEMPRWLLEQSVSITNHRYGNVGAGPVPQLP